MNIQVYPNTTPISIWMRVKRFSLQSMKNTATLVAIVAVTVTSLPTHFAFADSADAAVTPVPAQAEDEPDSSETVKVVAKQASKEIVKVATKAVAITSTPAQGVSVVRTYANVPFSAYTSRPEETDDTPFITADGSHVADGIIAANFLKFGTKVRIPKLFGDKVFVVHDRMNKRYPYKIDIWMENYSDAIKFGVRHADIEIVTDEVPKAIAEKDKVNEVVKL